MSSNYAKNMLASSQREANRSDQVQNNAGGFVFQLDVWGRLERFLILGSDGPTYYQSAKALTRENARVVDEAWAKDAYRTATTIENVSVTSRAPKNDPAIFALALGAVHTDIRARQLALGMVKTVCRTGTHLFMFVNFARLLGKGWGRAMKRAVGAWYESKTPDQVAYQAIKYRQREGYTHKRLLQTAHPAGKTNGGVYEWIVAEDQQAREEKADLPTVITHFMAAQAGTLAIEEWHRLPWEAYPTERLNDVSLWKAILPTMGLTAMVRNLGKMTAIGVLTATNEDTVQVLARLRDQDEIVRSRMHPLQFLTAMKVYSQGHGDRGSLVWSPVQTIVRALNDAFYMAFKNVTPSGKRFMLAIDVSGSMDHGSIAGSSFTPREGAAAMALVTATMEDRCEIVGFSRPTSVSVRDFRQGNLLVSLNIGPGQRLDDVIKMMAAVPMGGTDCSLPIEHAIQNKLEIDTFVIYTDSETYAGKRHPYVALQDYRKKSGIDAKLIVVGMTSTGFTIADPRDPGMLDIVGMDSNVPSLISNF